MQAANYYIESCSGSTSGVVDFGAYIPSYGEIYALIFAENALPGGCYVVVSADTTAIDVVSEFELFENCDYCVNGVPVNTFYESDLPGLPGCCESGTTANPPKPEYASGLGVAIQMNAVALGGFNGLNN